MEWDTAVAVAVAVGVSVELGLGLGVEPCRDSGNKREREGGYCGM